MNAKYYLDLVGIYVHTDFPLTGEEEIMRTFLNKIEDLEGVERISIARYHFEVKFGLMFNTKDCANRIIEATKDFYNLDSLDKFSISDILQKSEGISANEEEDEDNTMAQLSALFGAGEISEA